MANVEEKCSQRVSGGGKWGWLHATQCSRKAVVTRKGEGFCKQHDPEYREQKRKKAEAKWSEKWAVESARDLRKAIILKICEELTADEVRQAIEKWKAAA